MTTRFNFGSDRFADDDYLSLASLGRTDGPGVNHPYNAVAVSYTQNIGEPADVDIVGITLVKGQTYTFDIDDGYGDDSSVDLELSLVDGRGRLVVEDDGATSLDEGSDSTRDPLFTFTAQETGTYFLAVHAQANEYVDGTFRFSGEGSDTGDYRLVVSTDDVPSRTFLGSSSNDRSYGDARQNIQAQGGNDKVSLGGGDDLASGGSGSDSLYGGSGRDELAGDDGTDYLAGGSGIDVLVGGASRDRLFGGTGNDHLNGNSGNDDLSGREDDDRLFGGSGDDNLFGGSGDDRLIGGRGDDDLYGGSGGDIFAFLRGDSPFDPQGFDEDVIHDFTSLDQIDLSDLWFGELAYRGFGQYRGTPGEVRLSDLRSANDLQEVQVNLDSDRETEFAFLVETSSGRALDRYDFIL
jgi:Ca2+-binding RTX toxin-like protein